MMGLHACLDGASTSLLAELYKDHVGPPKRMLDSLVHSGLESGGPVPRIWIQRYEKLLVSKRGSTAVQLYAMKTYSALF